MSRLIIVSNRLPVSVSRHRGKFLYSESVGGVATGISSLSVPKKRLWFGWPGLPSDKLTDKNKLTIENDLQERGCLPVFLTSKEIREFYSGFSNKTLWPLFHYFSQYTFFDQHFWDAYKHVNQIFCDAILKHITPQDKIWIHDYQLLLLPQMVRQHLPNAHIGFFLHIPFPSFELIRHLPWRNEILNGILGADLIGFHEYDYVRHYLSSVYRITGHEHHLSELMVDDRLIRVDAFPMGIDYEKYAKSHELPKVKKNIEKMKTDTRIIISVDRLDYTKGILKRLEAYDWFLTKHSEYRGKIKLVVVAVPSRTKVEHYSLLRDEIEKTVSRINGTYGTLDWSPVSYIYRSLPFEELTALYHVADIAFITPLRDGMNLVAKEFLATQQNKDNPGIMILSEMAGAACELAESIVVNPHDKEQVVLALKEAIEMPTHERIRRNQLMQARISRYTVGQWAKDFIESLDDIKVKQKNLRTQQFTKNHQLAAKKQFAQASKKLLLLDYDGTLASFQKLPEDAKPDQSLLKLLEKLGHLKNTETVIISGRDKDTLSQWLGDLPINLVAEHGAFYREKNKKWRTSVTDETDWKESIRPILEFYMDRTPGSFVEEKNYSLVWHCRKSDPDLAKLRTQQLKDALLMLISNLNIGVFEGSRIVEVKDISVHKGQAVRHWIGNKHWKFIFCAGDDYTDEDMFSALPENAISCKIGTGPSTANFRLNSPEQLRTFITKLVE